MPETIAAETVVHLGFGTGDAHALLLALAARVTGRDGWRLAHACGRCGSSAHGRPVLVGPPGLLGQSRAPHVNLSRADGHCLVAVCVEAPVGVDLERPGAADGLESLWELDDGADRTRAWVRTEARLKALGTGFAVPAGNRRACGEAVQVLDLDLDLDCTADLVPWRAALAMAGPRRPVLADGFSGPGPSLSAEPAAAAAPSDPATRRRASPASPRAQAPERCSGR